LRCPEETGPARGVRGRLRGDEEAVRAAVLAVARAVVLAVEWVVVLAVAWVVALQVEDVSVPPAATVSLMRPGTPATRSNALPAGQEWSEGKYSKGITTCR